MGSVISLADRRRARRAAAAGHRRAVLFFDLADPGTYLAAERVERLPAALTWQPAYARSLPAGAPEAMADRAAALRLPFVWPERPAGATSPCRLAMRAAGYAAEQGRAAAFVLAASRLAFCGGFDLDDPEIVAEAAAAAGVGLGECLSAALDEARDRPIEAAGGFLASHGADAMPVVQVGRLLFSGERRLAEAAAAVRDGTLARSRVLPD